MSDDRFEHPGSTVRPRVRGGASRTTGVLPDVDAIRRWLLSGAICNQAGAIFSWSNPEHPGYPYPEAAGLFLSTLSTMSVVTDEHRIAADRTAGWLCASLGPNGGVGRDGIEYLFDSAVALSGLLRYRCAGGRVGGDDPIHRLRRFVCDQIAGGVAVQPSTAVADGRWSTQFGAHLVKCLHSLHFYARTFGEPVDDEVVGALISRSGKQPSPIYLHPFCYEQEGHFIVARNGLPSLFEPLDGTVDWLAALQRPDGAILAFANGIDGFGEARSDATAQAVRLWLLRDPRRYADPIAKALGFLAACQTGEGGIRYTPDTDDICTWSTMFTLQAVEWLIDGPRADELL